MSHTPDLLFVLLLLTATISCHCRAFAEEKSCKIVAGTEHISGTVCDLPTAKVEILTLIPATSCPGHNDIHSADMAFFRSGTGVLLRWQKDSPGIREAMQAANIQPGSLKFFQNTGSLLVPDNQIALGKESAKVLKTFPGVGTPSVQQRFDERRARVTALAAECRGKMAPYGGQEAFCALCKRISHAEPGRMLWKSMARRKICHRLW